jgi:hypothetical protein
MEQETRQQERSPEAAPKCYQCEQVTALVTVIPRFGHTPSYRNFLIYSPVEAGLLGLTITLARRSRCGALGQRNATHRREDDNPATQAKP